jgi:predicted nuclease of restriction endonuclease-like (RecB) superfamily
MTSNAVTRKEAELISASESSDAAYARMLADAQALIDAGRRGIARAANAAITTTYWMLGRRIVEFEQNGEARATYGDELLARLSRDLTRRFGRGYSERNLRKYRAFYVSWQIRPTASAELQVPTFPLPWSAYVALLGVDNRAARDFYEEQALRAGWSVRQLHRQIATGFYERFYRSEDREKLLRNAGVPLPEDEMTPEEEIRDAYVLEFAGLKDEYSESELEEALVSHLSHFLLEMGNDFSFVGRQRRLRVGDTWFRVDIVLFHRRSRRLVLVDLKVGKLTAGDMGQMQLYLNYARRHWMCEGESAPIGLILCKENNVAVARYAMEGSINQIETAEYTTVLPELKQIESEMTRACREIEDRLRRRG